MKRDLPSVHDRIRRILEGDSQEGSAGEPRWSWSVPTARREFLRNAAATAVVLLGGGALSGCRSCARDEEAPVRSAPRPKSQTKGGTVDPKERTVRALHEIRSFVQRVRAEPSLRVSIHDDVPPVSKKELDAFDAATGRRLPAALRAYFEEGVVQCTIEDDAEEIFAILDPLTLQQIQERLGWWGDAALADQLEEELEGRPNAGDALKVEHLRHGIPLWQREDPIVVSSQNGRVGRFDGEAGPSDPICDGLSEFLEHFVGAGMFNYGNAERKHFDRYWSIVEKLVPFSIDPKENKWLQHLDRRYEGDITR